MAKMALVLQKTINLQTRSSFGMYKILFTARRRAYSDLIRPRLHGSPQRIRFSRPCASEHCAARVSFTSGKAARVNPEGRKLIRNIRQACKAGRHVEALDSFSKLQQMGIPILSDVINSLLHVTAHAGNGQGFDEVIAAAERLNIPRDLVMQSNLVSGLSRLGRVDDALAVCNKFEGEGQVPRQQALSSLLNAALRAGHDVGVLRALDLLKKGKHHPGTENSVLLMESVMPGKPLEGREDIVHELLGLYEALTCGMEAPVADRVVMWAESCETRTCTRASVSPNVECSNCHHKIDRNEPSLEDYLQLQHHIHYVLEKDIQSFLDTKNTITEMIQLKELVKQEGSFQIVVDGLNVGFFQKQEFSIDRLIEVAIHCAEKLGKVLVIARSHIQKHMNRSGIVRSKGVLSCHHMEEHDVHFLYVRNRMIDDLFFVYATLVSSPDTYFLSNDQLGDITRDFPSDLFSVFKRWQKFKQVSLTSEYRPGVSITPILQFPLPYNPMVQKHSKGRGWHIPVESSRTWLCLQQNA